MLPVFLALSIWVMALIGLGAATRGFFFDRKEGPGKTSESGEDVDPTLLGLSGLMTVSVVGTLVNFVAPLTPWLSAGIAAIGIALFFRKGKGLLPRIPPLEATVLSLSVGFLSFVASGSVLFYDTGLYHLQAVMWTTSGPVPFGLANLHRRFGLNSSLFPAAALLELPGFEGRSPSLAAPLVLFFFGAAVVAAMRRCATGEATLSRLFMAFGALPFFLFAADKSVPSLSTDLPVTLLAILSAYFLIRCGEDPADPLAPRAAVVLALFAFTVKVSAGAWLLACVVAARVLPAAPAAVLLLPWLVRGVALSGCLLYPSLATRIDALPWAVAPALARGEVAWARSWARLPGGNPEEVLRGWSWVGPWLRTNAVRPSVLPLLAMAVAGGACLLRASGGKRAARALPASSWLVPSFVAGFSSVFWFLSAPDTRFGYGALFTLAALLLVGGLLRLGFAEASRGVRASAVWLLVAGLFFAAFAAILRREGEAASARLRFISPPRPHVPSFEEKKTAQGVLIRVPRGDDRCFAVPLPCTPFFDPALRIRLSPDGIPRRFTLPSD